MTTYGLLSQKKICTCIKTTTNSNRMQQPMFRRKIKILGKKQATEVISMFKIRLEKYLLHIQEEIQYNGSQKFWQEHRYTDQSLLM